MDIFCVDKTCFLTNVKIIGDGTQVSQSMHILVLAFTILEGNANPNSPSGNHTNAMPNAQEKYEYLSHAVKDIGNEIESIQSITIDATCNFSWEQI